MDSVTTFLNISVGDAVEIPNHPDHQLGGRTGTVDEIFVCYGFEHIHVAVNATRKEPTQGYAFKYGMLVKPELKKEVRHA